MPLQWNVCYDMGRHIPKLACLALIKVFEQPWSHGSGPIKSFKESRCSQTGVTKKCLYGQLSCFVHITQETIQARRIPGHHGAQHKDRAGLCTSRYQSSLYKIRYPRLRWDTLREESHPLVMQQKHLSGLRTYKLWDGTPRLLLSRLCPYHYTMFGFPASFAKALRYPLVIKRISRSLKSSLTALILEVLIILRCLLMSTIHLFISWLAISGPGTLCCEAHLILCKLLRPRAPFPLADWLANPAAISTAWHLGHTLCRPPVATRRGAWLGTQGPPLCAKQFEPAWLLTLSGKASLCLDG